MPKLLLVDDAENNLLTLEALFQDEGFEVDTAGSCAAARERLTAAGLPYALVLLDLHLGDGSGVELVPLIRERHPATRVLIMSGSVDREQLPAQADGCFAKGRAFPELLALVRGALG